MTKTAALIVFGTLLAPCVYHARAEVLSLDKAVSSGRVRVILRGTGAASGDSVLLTVSRTPKSRRGPLVLNLPTGTVIHSWKPGFQDMVVMRVRGLWLRPGYYRPGRTVTVPVRGSPVCVLHQCGEIRPDIPGALHSRSPG